MSQTELPFAPNLTPAKRREPRLWVKELAVYREWHPEALQRRISLRQGLNIIWAEPSEQGAGGHAAGKTTFCRFLRYLLGDANYGSEPFRDAFRVKFPNAWIVGEVYLDEEPWVVARFAGITGNPHWSARGVNIERLFDESIERLTAAIYRRIFDAAKAEEPADGPKSFQYIITTTEPPPEDLRRTPWLVHPPFSSAEKSRRFLGENL